MAWFVVVGSIGLLIIVLSLVFDDMFEGVFDALDIDVGAGLFSTPVIGSFLAAFGLVGSLVVSSTPAGSGIAALAGVVAGVVMGGVAFVVTRALMGMPTDEPVRLSDMVGKEAVVVSAIPQDGFGEVTLVHLGQRMKLNARSPRAVARGETVVVVAVHSASSVVVEDAGSFWDRPAPLQQGE